MIKKILGAALVLIGVAVVTVVAPMNGVMQSVTLGVLLALGWALAAILVVAGMLLFGAGVQEAVAADLANRLLSPEQIDELRDQLITPELLAELRDQLLTEDAEETDGESEEPEEETGETTDEESYDKVRVPKNVDDLLSDVVDKAPGALTEHMKS
ncbi:hypothetical protein [Fimbriiglobus ruber]|uniref:Transmembrane protein n=1 Tax=Fimbriiglobus ruber TaxID=1908690 RepID=A0A225EEE4_9BACT|nr:hypothetical protein [Fimbriiglobus ruber]OWK46745.1 hypothetical protein FRUB_00444 [Fimbriiglobus ruber]